MKKKTNLNSEVNLQKSVQRLKRDEVMALPVEILRAKAAVLYKPPESSEESQVQPEPKPVVLLDQLSVIEDIIDCQEKLNRLKIKTDRQKLQEEWSNPLGTDLVEALTHLVTKQFS